MTELEHRRGGESARLPSPQARPATAGHRRRGTAASHPAPRGAEPSCGLQPSSLASIAATSSGVCITSLRGNSPARGCNDSSILGLSSSVRGSSSYWRQGSTFICRLTKLRPGCLGRPTLVSLRITGDRTTASEEHDRTAQRADAIRRAEGATRRQARGTLARAAREIELADSTNSRVKRTTQRKR